MPLTIDSNQSSLSYAQEESLQVLPGVDGANAVWFPLEPNTYSSFGGDTKTVMREPITATRQRYKGTVTDLDVKAGFTTDVTEDNLTRLLQGFLFALAHEKPKTAPLNSAAIPVTAVAAGSLTAAFGTAWHVGSIVQSKGFANAPNNSLTRVTASTGASLTVAPYLGGAAEAVFVAEVPPATATLETVGFALSGDVLLYGPGSTLAGATVVLPVLVSAATIDFTTLPLLPGEWFYLGDADDLLTDTSASEYNFMNTGGTRNRGYCRIATISAHQITTDLYIPGSTPWDLGGGAGGSCAIGASGYVSMFFGTVIRNEPLPANIVRSTYTLQRYLGVGAGGQNNLEAITGAIPNELSLTIPSNNKLTADLTFVAMNTVQQYLAAMPGTYTPLAIEPPFNTSENVFAMFLYVIDSLAEQTPLFGYATDQKLQINNNVKPNKAIGVVGAFEGNTGMFDVSGTLTCYFDDIAAQQAVANNANVGLTNIFSSATGGFIIDLPILTLALPGLKVEKDKPIMADISHNASQGVNGFTLLYNKFSYLPAPALSAYNG